MTPSEVVVDNEPQEALDVTQQNEGNGLDGRFRDWDGTHAYANGSEEVAVYDPEHAGNYYTEEAGALASDEGAAVDYWEEVALEDGSVCFYNHTSQEYSSELPAIDPGTPINEGPAYTTNEDELQRAETAESNNESQSGMLEGQVWDGNDGEVFVPWPEEESQAMKTSPDAAGPRDGQPDTPEEEEEEPFTPDDPAIVREQNLRALLVLLPAKVMKGVVKAAMEGAMLHTQRTATADAERRRRSLLSSKAPFRHTMTKSPTVATPGQLVTTGGKEREDGRRMSGEMDFPSDQDGEAVQAANTPDSWRNTTTQERETIVGDKLHEVLRVLYSTSKEEARLTMRAIYLSSQGIGAAGAYQLAPALKSCVIVALHLGNNAMGDKGIIALADGLRHARGLQKLHLNDNEITDVGCHRLANALGPLKVLFALDLCHNPFGDKACLSLATYLSQPGCPLRSLSVAGCLDVDPAAWKTITVRGREGMGWDPPRPGDDGAVSLAAALMCPHGCPLRRIRMANMGMKTIGAKAVAAALCANHTLESIDLSGNNLASKADDSAWESASELLSFGLQVNRTVHTIGLRACGLSREQVLAIQANTVPQTNQAQKFPGHEEEHPSAELGWGGTGSGGDGGDGGGAANDVLPWREEKRLGFRAACLRDWLLDAARVKGMRYPRPQSLDQGGTDMLAKKTPADGQNGNEGFPPGTPQDSNQSEDQDHLPVERQLRTGLEVLQRLVASYEAGEPLPRGSGGVGDVCGSTCRDTDGGREEIVPSQALETERAESEANSDEKEGSDDERRELPSTSGGTEASMVVTDTTRPPPTNGNSEVEGCQELETRTTSTSHSTAPASSRPQESTRSSGSTDASKQISDCHRSAGSGRSAGIPTSDRGARGGIRDSLLNKEGGSAVKAKGDTSSHSEAVGRTISSNDPGGPPALAIPESDALTRGKRGTRDNRHTSPVLCGREGMLVRAVDLEAGAQEGRKLASLAATARQDLDEKEAALLRESQSLFQERDELKTRTVEEAWVLEKSLVEAGAARDVASDSVRRLEPIATAARESERAGRAELEEWRLISGGLEAGPTETGLISVEQLEIDCGERSRRAQAMAGELQEAQRCHEMVQRRIEELKEVKRSVLSRTIEYDVTFREKSARISASVAHVRIRRNALRETESVLTDVAVKMDEFTQGAHEEEALRALVPAGSERRDLDLQVFEAVQLTSKVAREVAEARLRSDEAALRLERARRGTAVTKSSDEDDPGLEVSAAAGSMIRPKTAPTFSPRKSTSDETKLPLSGSLPGDRHGKDGQHARERERSSSARGPWRVGGATGEESKAPHEAVAGTGTADKAGQDGRPGESEQAAGLMRAEAENEGWLVEECSNADKELLDAVARGESAKVKRALALIRDHGDILRLKERDTPEDNNDALVQGGARRKRLPRGETSLLGVQLNSHIALGAKIALIRGAGEEDEEGNPILPEIDDRFLTVGQRLRRLRDAREGVQREKQRAYVEYSRQVKTNLRARKRFVLAEKRAGRIAQTMDTKQLVEALKERGYNTEGSEHLDQLRRVFANGIKPEMRVRLHATSRSTNDIAGMTDHVDEVTDTASRASSSREDNRIKVVCRVRPPVSHELRHETHGAKTLSVANRCVVVAGDKCTVTLNTKPREKSFTFDFAAGEDSTQEEVFAEVGKPVTEACLEGNNGTIICYGQTGSGKTFTTFGPGAVMENHLNPSDLKSYALRGLVPRVLEYLYANIARQEDSEGSKLSYSCKCSFYEIFNEKVFDLMDESNNPNPTGLTVREDTWKGVYVEGLMENDVDGVDSTCEILRRGFRNRHVGETAMNRESSRSHAVFTLVVQATEVVEEEGLTRSRVARFNLVDLAGSERQKDTQASGVRLKEASDINKSLSTPGQVMDVLVEKSPGRFRHVHYRDSKPTCLLHASLGGNSKTALVAALSPAAQNLGETLSTLKSAQGAKMIKNEAVKNENKSGIFDALKRGVAALRQQLAAAQQPDGGGGGSRRVPRAIAAAAGCEQPLPEVGPRDGLAAAGAVDAAGSEAPLAEARRRARSAEDSRAGSRRRIESLLATLEKGEKTALRLKKAKFRDGAIERATMAGENAHLMQHLEGGPNESAEVEAEAGLAEPTGNENGDGERLVWGIADEERLHGELEEKVLKLIEKKLQLTEAAGAFEARKKRRLTDDRAESETEMLAENALLTKLQEDTQAALAFSEERAAALETERAHLGAVVSALTEQLQGADRSVEAGRREEGAALDRDARIADRQSIIEELSRARERAVEDGGSELASLELKKKMIGFIKDNSDLPRANTVLEEEADGLDRELEELEADKEGLKEKTEAERVDAKLAIESLERRMQQQQEAHERELGEQQAQRRSAMEDFEAVTQRLRSVEEAHENEADALESRVEKAEVEAALKQLHGMHDALSDQARSSQGRNQKLDFDSDFDSDSNSESDRSDEIKASLSVVKEALANAERRAEGEEYLRLAQEAVSTRALEACSDRDQEIERLQKQLGAARRYAEGVRALFAARQGDQEVRVRGSKSTVGDVVGGNEETASSEAMAGGIGAGMCREPTGTQEGAMERVQRLERMMDEFVWDQDRLMDEVCGPQSSVEELQPNGGVVAVTLAGTSVELEAANTGLERVVEQKEAVHKALGVQEAHRSELTEDAASTGSTAAGLAAAAVEAEGRSKKKELDTALPGVWDLCLKYHARATTAEQSVEDLIADVARLQGEERAALSPTRENALITLGENREKVRATEEALEAAYDNFAAKSEKLGALRGELEEVRLEAAAAACGERLGRPLKADADAERLEAAKEEVAVGKGTVRVLEREVRRLEAGVRDRDTERDLDTARKEVGALKTELGSVGRKLASAEERVGSVREALGAAEARAEEAEGRLGELREAAAEMELESKRDVAAAKAQLEEMGERLSVEVAKTQASKDRAQQAWMLKTNAEELVASLDREVNHLRTESEKLESYTEKTLQKFKDKYLVATSRFKAQMAEKDQEIDYLERKLQEALPAQSASSGDRFVELEAKISHLRALMSERDDAHLEALFEEEDRRSEMQKAHEAAIAVMEENVTKALDLAEQVEADRDSTLDALRAHLAREHGEELDALLAKFEEVVQTTEAKEAEALELFEECNTLSAKLKRVGGEARSAAGGLAEKLEAAEEARAAMEEALPDTGTAATEEQLRHRLTAQVAEGKELQQELMDTRQRSDRAEAAVRGSEQRARDGADEETKKLLVEMENLRQEKLIAEHKAGDMKAELHRLRQERVAALDKTMNTKRALGDRTNNISADASEPVPPPRGCSWLPPPNSVRL